MELFSQNGSENQLVKPPKLNNCLFPDKNCAHQTTFQHCISPSTHTIFLKLKGIKFHYKNLF